jgi:hypothetical protein
MQEEVRQHHDNAVSTIVRRGMSEDALPDLRFANVVADGHPNNSLSIAVGTSI